MWLKFVERTQDDNHHSALAVKASAGTVTCQLVARSSTLQDLKIELQDRSCILLGAACGNVEVQGREIQRCGQHKPGACASAVAKCTILLYGVAVQSGAHLEASTAVIREV